MFAAEIEPADTNGRRRSPRRPVSLDVEFGRGGLERALCKVVDISIHGARLHTFSALKRGRTIWLTLPEIGYHAADIVWADDFTAGCEFLTPLTAAQLALVVERDMSATLG